MAESARDRGGSGQARSPLARLEPGYGAPRDARRGGKAGLRMARSEANYCQVRRLSPPVKLSCSRIFLHDRHHERV